MSQDIPREEKGMMIRPIDANALLTVPNARKVTEYDEAGYGITYHAVPVQDIKDAPTLDYEPVAHSQWMLYEMHLHRVTVDGFVVCPECEHHFDRIKGTWFKRCPECGAKMDGGKR